MNSLVIKLYHKIEYLIKQMFKYIFNTLFLIKFKIFNIKKILKQN